VLTGQHTPLRALRSGTEVRPFRDFEVVGSAAIFVVAARVHRSSWVLTVGLLLTVGLTLALRNRLGAKIVSALIKILLVAFVAVLVSARANAMLKAFKTEGGPITFTGTLRSDPAVGNGATTAVIEVGSRRYRLSGRGFPGASLRRLSAGHVVTGTGSVRVMPKRSWRIAKHLVGDLEMKELRQTSKGSSIGRLANNVRATLLASSAHFGRTDRALFAGFVLGDARDQPVWVTDEFRAAGLTHLLVVSGQNVAFVLAIARPLLNRLRRRRRLLLTFAILFLFAVVTRFEPSVQRAAVMAALSSGALTFGRPQRSLRILALTVCVLCIYDPMLAWSVGFGLSVGACSGLAILTPKLESVLRGPSWIRTPLATTLGAQCGASLVMVPIFGGVPVVSIIANLLALPAAEPVMSWGIAAGLPAGVLGRFVGSGPARIVHLPTEVCLWWVRSVARVCSQLPLGQFSMVHLFGGGVVILLLRRGTSTRIVTFISLLTFAFPAIWTWTRPSSLLEVSVGRSATAWGVRGAAVRTVDVLILDYGSSAIDVLEGLRRNRIGAIDLVVVRSGGRLQRDVITAIAARRDVGAVLSASRAFAGSVRPLVEARPGTVVKSGRHLVVIDAVEGGRLGLHVESVQFPVG
jgi:competence protein ComEC